MSKIFNLNLDVRKNNYICLSDFKVGDNLSTIYGHMLQNSVSYDLTGLTLRVNFKDSQGNLYFQDSSKGVSIVNPVEGTFKIDVLSSVLSVEGIIKADISIFKGTQKLTSSTFSMEVVETVYKNEAIIGTDGKDLLQEVVGGETDRVNAEKIRKINESDRVEKENIRKASEIVRESSEVVRKNGYSKMDTRIDNLVLGQGSATEVIDSRLDGISNIKYPTLKARLDDTSNQLTQNALATLTTSASITSLDNATDGLMQVDSIKGNTLQNLCDLSQKVEGNVEAGLFYKFNNSASLTIGKKLTFYNPNDKIMEVRIKDKTARYLTLNPYETKVETLGVAEYAELVRGHVKDGWGESNKQSIKGFILEGDHTPNPPSYFEGIKSTGEFEGRNLFDKTTITSGYLLQGLNGNTSPNSTGCYSDYIKVMPNYSYTISIGIGSATYGHCFYDSSKRFISGVVSSPSGKQTVTTPINAMYIRVSLLIANLDKQQMEEGIDATEYRPYQDYKIEILSHGKNLIDNGIDAWDKIMFTNGYLSLTNDTTAKAKSIYYRVKEGEHYYFSATGYTVGGSDSDYKSINVAFVNITSPDIKLETKAIAFKGISIPTTITMGNIVAPPGATHVYIYVIAQNGTLHFKNVQMEEGAVVTPYEPYKEDKIAIQLKEPLRGLPNGVCDEIVGDKLVTRVGKRLYKLGDENNPLFITDKIDTYYKIVDTVSTTINPSSLKSFNDGSIVLDNAIPPIVDLKYPTSISGRLSSVENTVDDTVDRTQKLEEALFTTASQVIDNKNTIEILLKRILALEEKAGVK